MAEHGAKAVRDAVAGLLRADLPPRIDMMCSLWAVDAAVLPKPDMVVSGDKADALLDQRGKTWIEVTTPRLMPGVETVGMTPGKGNLVGRFKYQARIYCWTVDEQWAVLLDKRDRLMTAMRDCLLDYPTLLLPPAKGDSGMLVLRDRLTEEFGVPYRIPKNPRAWAGGLLTYEIVEEYEIGAASTRPQPVHGVDWSVTLLNFRAPNTPIGAMP